MTILEYLKKYATQNPQKLFLKEGTKSWSFGSFYEEVAKLSTFFIRQGIKKADYVVIHLDQKSEHLLTYTALLNIGAVSVHLYPEREDEYVEFAAEHTSAKAVVSNTFKKKISSVPVLDFPAHLDLEPTYGCDSYEIAYVMFTSGTTSSPKAVLTTQDNIRFVTETLIELAGIREGEEKEIILLPLGSTGGLGHFHAALMRGNTIRLFPGFYSSLDDKGLDMLLESIEEESATGILLTPGLITKMLNTRKEKLKTAGKTLRYALANVTPMKKETIAELLELLPYLRFCTYYGSTEASRSIVNVCRENGEFMHLTGKPSKGVAIKLHNKNDAGEGEIYIKGGNVMKGYLHDEAASFDEGWFQSGDIGRIDENGFIRVIGRIKDTISLDGLKVFPMEIEAILSMHKDIKDVGVCPLIDEQGATQIGLAVVLKEDETDKEALAREAAALLSKSFKCDKTDLYRYKIPKKIYFERRIPRTDLGKIKRDELCSQLARSGTSILIKG